MKSTSVGSQRFGSADCGHQQDQVVGSAEVFPSVDQLRAVDAAGLVQPHDDSVSDVRMVVVGHVGKALVGLFGQLDVHFADRRPLAGSGLDGLAGGRQVLRDRRSASSPVPARIPFVFRFTAAFDGDFDLLLGLVTAQDLPGRSHVRHGLVRPRRTNRSSARMPASAAGLPGYT